MEFQIVGTVEDLVNRTSLNAGDQPSALAQPRAKDGMRQVSGGFGKRRHSERLRRAAMAEPRNLRKDEPHPVTALAAGAELTQYGLVYRLLRIDKPLQLKAIVHRPRRSYRQPPDIAGRISTTFTVVRSAFCSRKRASSPSTKTVTKRPKAPSRSTRAPSSGERAA